MSGHNKNESRVVPPCSLMERRAVPRVSLVSSEPCSCPLADAVKKCQAGSWSIHSVVLLTFWVMLLPWQMLSRAMLKSAGGGKRESHKSLDRSVLPKFLMASPHSSGESRKEGPPALLAGCAMPGEDGRWRFVDDRERDRGKVYPMTCLSAVSTGSFSDFPEHIPALSRFSLWRGHQAPRGNCACLESLSAWSPSFHQTIKTIVPGSYFAERRQKLVTLLALQRETYIGKPFRASIHRLAALSRSQGSHSRH